MSANSLFRRLDEQEQHVKVGVDDAQVLVPTRGKRAIGTQGLNGCTCIVVLARAILVAHIAPLPGTFQQWQRSRKDVAKAGHDHLAGSLTRVGNLMRHHRDDFPVTSIVFGIFSLGGQGPMTSVINQSQAFFNDMGFDIRRSFYREIAPETWSPPKGGVVAFFNRDGQTELFQESIRLWPSQAQDSASRPSQAGSTSTQQVAPQNPTPATPSGPFGQSAPGQVQSAQSTPQASESTQTVTVGRYTFTKDRRWLWSPSINQWMPLMKDKDGVQRVQIGNKAYRLQRQDDNLMYVDEAGRNHVL